LNPLFQVLINYPEPPLWSGGEGESKLHLLTDTFLGLVLEVTFFSLLYWD